MGCVLIEFVFSPDFSNLRLTLAGPPVLEQCRAGRSQWGNVVRTSLSMTVGNYLVKCVEIGQSSSVVELLIRNARVPDLIPASKS